MGVTSGAGNWGCMGCMGNCGFWVHWLFPNPERGASTLGGMELVPGYTWWGYEGTTAGYAMGKADCDVSEGDHEVWFSPCSSCLNSCLLCEMVLSDDSFCLMRLDLDFLLRPPRPVAGSALPSCLPTREGPAVSRDMGNERKVLYVIYPPFNKDNTGLLLNTQRQLMTLITA